MAGVSTLGSTIISATPWRRLERFFADHGTSLGAVAIALGCSPVLFERVIHDRQAMPRDLIEQIAAWLGVQAGDVAECVARVTMTPGPRSWQPVPARPILGDRLEVAVVAPTVPSP